MVSCSMLLISSCLSGSFLVQGAMHSAKCRHLQVPFLCCRNVIEQLSGLELASLGRRRLGGSLLSLPVITLFPISVDALENTAAEFKFYTNDADKYSLLVPPDWVQGEGKSMDKRNVVAFFPSNDISANVNVLITGLGADYTSLGSFGSVNTFAEKLVNSLDRSWKKPPGQAAKLIDCRAKNGTEDE